jgi:hypothetical protein
MTVDELREISAGLGNLVHCTPLKGGGSQRYWEYPHYSKIPGFKTDRTWPSLAMDARRNELFKSLVDSSKGEVALISLLTNDGDHDPAVSYLVGFTEHSDALMFRLSWSA